MVPSVIGAINPQAELEAFLGSSRVRNIFSMVVYILREVCGITHSTNSKVKSCPAAMSASNKSKLFF